MSGPGGIARWRSWFSGLPPLGQVAFYWSLGFILYSLTMVLLRLVGLIDTWAVVGLNVAGYGALYGLLLLGVSWRTRRQVIRQRRESGAAEGETSP